MSNAVPMIRAFVALDLPLDVLNKAVELQRELSEHTRALGARLAWVPAANLHVTLKFLGEVAVENAVTISEGVASLSDHPPLSLTLGGVGAFPRADQPRVIWVGVQCADDGLIKLVERVETQMDALGFERETRPYHPHLTLARVKTPMGGLLDGFESRQLGSCTADQIALYRSDLERKGAQYHSLYRVDLGDKGSTAATENLGM